MLRSETCGFSIWCTTVSPGRRSLFLAHGGKSLRVHRTVKQTYVCWANKCYKRMGLEKNYQRRHNDFDLRSDGPCSWQHHILVREFACFALSLVNREIYNIAIRGISCHPHFYTIFCGFSWQILAKQPPFKCYHSLDGNFFLWGIAAVSISQYLGKSGTTFVWPIKIFVAACRFFARLI